MVDEKEKDVKDTSEDKPKKEDDMTPTKKPDKLFGQSVIKSGSAIATMPEPKDENPVKIDYKETYKNTKVYENKIKIHVDMGEERFPPESKVPNKRKYNEKGEYIKHKNVVLESDKKKDPKELPTYSMTQVMKEQSLTNPNRKSGNKRFKR
jgi:hypothetical protein